MVVHLRCSVPPPPDQILWENLQFGWATRFVRRAAVNAILLAQCAFSTWVIVTVTNYNIEKQDLGQSDEGGGGGGGGGGKTGVVAQAGTMVWTTVVIVLSNLLIFLTAPVYADLLERDARVDHRETMLAMKLLFFQLANSFAASLSFLWTKKRGPVGFFDRHWYEHGGGATVISMVLADIFFINPFVEGMRIFDLLIAKTYAAPRALAQDQMNRLWAAENPLYLPFRMQLLLKQVVFGAAWGYAFPIFYVLVAVYLGMSIVIDRSGLLRTFRGLVTTSDKMYMATITQVMPAALVLHALLGFLCAHHRELQSLGLISDNATAADSARDLDAFGAFDRTVRNANVAIAFVLLCLSAVFAVVFVVVTKAMRHRRKRGIKGLDAASASSFPTDRISFRELDAVGGDPRLYIPPLTRMLLKGCRDRDASQAYHTAPPPAHRQPQSAEAGYPAIAASVGEACVSAQSASAQEHV